MRQEKLTAALTDRLRMADPAELVDVVVELREFASEESPSALDGRNKRNARVAALREAFGREAEHLKGHISHAGGEVLAAAWINRTLRARVPASELGNLTDFETVAAVDLPRRLEAE
jgi:hypothetical protein